MKEEGCFDESQAQAVKEVVAWKLAQTGMTEGKLIRLEDR
jgi:hypothetical protein